MTELEESQFQKAVLIVGSDHPNLAEVQELYEKEGYIIIGDGEKSIEDILRGKDFEQLKDKVGPNTRFDIWAHGNLSDGNHYVDGVETDILLSYIEQLYEGQKHIHLHSCFAGAAKEYITSLSMGSVLITHGEDSATFTSNNKQAIIYANKNRDNNLHPAIEFANNFFNDSVHTVTFSWMYRDQEKIISLFSRYINEHPAINLEEISQELVAKQVVEYYNISIEDLIKKVHFVLKPRYVEEHPVLLANYREILKYFNEKRKEFVEDSPIKEEDLKPLTLEEAEIWAKKYFKYLVDKDDKNLIKALKESAKKKDKRFEKLIDDSILSLACKSNSLEMIRVLIANEAIACEPLLITAFRDNNKKLVEEICKDPELLNHSDKYGRTALHIAAQESNMEIVEALIGYKADLNILNNTLETPLDIAKTKGNTKVTTALKKVGAQTRNGVFIRHSNTFTGLLTSCANYMQLAPFTTMITIAAEQSVD